MESFAKALVQIELAIAQARGSPLPKDHRGVCAMGFGESQSSGDRTHVAGCVPILGIGWLVRQHAWFLCSIGSHQRPWLRAVNRDMLIMGK
eukprot:6482665-Amphidinium_carterae.1